MRSLLLFVAVLVVGCGASSSSPSSSGSACAIEASGPLITMQYVNAPRPAAVGGPILDGDYDLVQIVGFSESGKRWTTDKDVFRVALRVRTTERSANHTGGQVTMRFEQPPSSKCATSSFALFQDQFRSDSNGAVEVHEYTAPAPGQLQLHYTDSAKWIFRKRP